MRSLRSLLLVAAMAPVVMANHCAGHQEGVPASSGDVFVQGIEVTQGIQTAGQTVPLVAQRGTAVRATVGVANRGAATGVTGVLHVFVDGTEITPAAGLAPINASFTAFAPASRDVEAQTLNFELPSPSGLVGGTTATFRVDLTWNRPDDPSNNSLAVSLPIIAAKRPLIFGVPVNYTPGGAGAPATSLVGPGSGDLFLRATFPVDDGNTLMYRMALMPPLLFGGAPGQDRGTAGVIDGSDGPLLMGLLGLAHATIVAVGFDENVRNTFVYGWVAGNPISGNGLGQTPGFLAFGNTAANRFQRTFAHEVGHNFGMGHNTRTVGDPGWDVGARLPGAPAGNGVPAGRIKSDTLSDIMVGGLLTNQAWIDPTSHGAILAAVAAPGGTTVLLPDTAAARPLVVQGVVDPTGRRLLHLWPALRSPWRRLPTPESVRAEFVAEVTDDRGAVTRRRFDAWVSDDDGKNGPPERGFFQVVVPVDPGREVARLRILRAGEAAPLGGFERTAPPAARLRAPVAGATLDERARLTWEVRDRDTRPSDLSITLAYSHDGGASWMPTAVGLSGSDTTVVVDTRHMARASGNGVLRLIVTDGLNTVTTDVGGLGTPRGQLPPDDRERR